MDTEYDSKSAKGEELRINKNIEYCKNPDCPDKDSKVLIIALGMCGKCYKKYWKGKIPLPEACKNKVYTCARPGCENTFTQLPKTKPRLYCCDKCRNTAKKQRERNSKRLKKKNGQNGETVKTCTMLSHKCDGEIVTPVPEQDHDQLWNGMMKSANYRPLL